MRPENKIADVREVLPEFQAYKDRNPMWGKFHAILDDGNTETRFCVLGEHAEPDTEEEARLRSLLLRMSRTQRDRLRNLVR